MTKDEAINLLDNLIGMVEDSQDNDYDEALKMAIEALERTSNAFLTHECVKPTHECVDLISRQAAIDALKNISDPYVPHPGNDIYWCVKAIEELSSVEPVGNSDTLDEDMISRCELFNRLAVIPAPPEANEYKAEVYKVINGM